MITRTPTPSHVGVRRRMQRGSLGEKPLEDTEMGSKVSTAQMQKIELADIDPLDPTAPTEVRKRLGGA